jgi:hypothetical protein
MFASNDPHPAIVHEDPEKLVLTSALDTWFMVHDACGSPVHGTAFAVPVKV